MTEIDDINLVGAEFIREYFAGTQGNYFIGCFRNADSKLPRGQVATLLTKVPSKIDSFIAKHDKPETQTAIYYCSSSLRPGHARRTIDDCWEFVSLFADVDDKNHDLSWGQVIAALEALPCPPSLIVNSGHGFAPHWLFTAPSDDAARVEALRKKLQAILASDAVHDAPRLMRLPGTHNSKFGDWLDVEVVRRSDRRYSLDELENWLATAGVAIPKRAQPKTNGHARTNGSSADFAAPIDIEARLAAMAYKGAGESSIHITQLQCTAALLRSGVGLEETARTILDATQRAVADDTETADWDWNQERRDITKMALAFISKNPELACLLPEALFATRQDQLHQGTAEADIDTAPWPTPYARRPATGN